MSRKRSIQSLPVRVVIDLNVVVSSVLGGPAAGPMTVMKLLNEGKLVGYASPFMIERLATKLSSDKIQRYIARRFPGELARFRPYVMLNLYLQRARIIEPEVYVDASSDPEDNEVLSVACEAGVDFVITLDNKDIIGLRNPTTKKIVIEDEDGNEVCRFKILTPGEFLEELRKMELF